MALPGLLSDYHETMYKTLALNSNLPWDYELIDKIRFAGAD